MSSTYTTITNGQLTAGQPADTTLFTALAENDDYQKTSAPNGGSGIEPNADAFSAAMTAHSHDGTAGQGQPVPAGGIAAGGINASDMIADGNVTSAKISTSSPIQTAKFADGAVTTAKMDGTMGSAAFSGSQLESVGTTMTIAHGLGRRPVVVNRNSSEFYIQSTSSTSVVVATTGAVDPWSWDFRCC